MGRQSALMAGGLDLDAARLPVDNGQRTRLGARPPGQHKGCSQIRTNPVITYEDGGLRVAECCWDEIASPASVDLVRLLYRSESAAGDRVLRCPTFRVSLRVVENPLRGAWEQLMYVFEPETAGRAQRGMGLNIACHFHFQPPRRDLEQLLRFAADGVRWDGCPPAGVPRLVARSEGGGLRLSAASDQSGRVLAQHCYLCLGDRARLLDGACARAVDAGSPEDAETIQCADRYLLYSDMVTLQESDVETLDLPVPDSANSGIGLRGRSLTLYNTERALSPAGRRALLEP
jgi:hypothetical protein